VLDRALPGRDGAAAPPLRLLPTLVGESALAPADPGAPGGVPFAVDEHHLEVVGWTCSRGRRTCWSSATPAAASRACSGSSPTAWPPATRPTRSRWWSSTRAGACSN
jgi:hypothetical protein